jgi:ribosomal protein L7/L12
VEIFSMSDEKKVLPSEAIRALERGSKIDAIKSVRVSFEVGLKEAKEIVERYIDSNPSTQKRMAAANADSAKSALGWLFAVIAFGVVAYYFLAD